MFRTRVISAIVGIVILLIVVISGNIALGLAVFILSIIGLYEFYGSIESSGYKPIKAVGYLFSIPILLIGMKEQALHIFRSIDAFMLINYLAILLFVVLFLLLSVMIFSNNKYNVVDISLSLFGVFYVPFLFSFIVLTRSLNNGSLFVWLIFIGAWSTDTFAYFSGRLFGRVKLMPVISPKKTVEGAVGGVLGCVAMTVIYGFILNNFIPSISIYHFLILGVLCGVLSQIGDLSASAIKRYVKVKDYGNVMPGHGGVLDRFDSILFIAPVVYFYISLIILK